MVEDGSNYVPSSMGNFHMPPAQVETRLNSEQANTKEQSDYNGST